MGENITYIYYLFGRIVAPQPSQLSDLVVMNALTPPRLASLLTPQEPHHRLPRPHHRQH
jgi:hypothetical protein